MQSVPLTRIHKRLSKSASLPDIAISKWIIAVLGAPAEQPIQGIFGEVVYKP